MIHGRIGPFFMLERRTYELTDIRAIDGANPIIEGHAAVFNQKSHDMGFREIIMPGAFTEAIKTDDVKFLLNHRGLPIARTKSGTLRLSEDSQGLAFRAQLEPTDPDVQRLLPKVKRGDLNEMSFAFGVADRSTDERWYRENGEMFRALIKVRLSDISAVSFPAYPSTDLSARSFYEVRMKEIEKDPDEKKPDQDDQEPVEKPADPEIVLAVPRIASPTHSSYEEIIHRARVVMDNGGSEEDQAKREIEQRKAAREWFLSTRLPKPDPFSYAEILKKSRHNDD